jgi:hypothetical protein
MYLKLPDELDKVFKRVLKDNAASTDTQLAGTLAKHKKIRHLRKKNMIFIGLDRNKRKSVVFMPPDCKPKKITKRGYYWP